MLRIAPSFIIAGVQKAATTSLWNYFCEHDDIIGPDNKEIDFFCSDREQHLGVQNYLHHFPRKLPWRIRKKTFEASPVYSLNPLLSKKSAQGIHEFDPSMKLIFVLRSPTDRAFSAWNMYKNFFKNKSHWHQEWYDYLFFNSNTKLIKNTEFGKSFKNDVLREIDFLTSSERSEQEFYEYSIVEPGCYSSILEEYIHFFSVNQLKIVFTEDLKTKPLEVLNDICTFLNIKHLSPDKIDTSTIHNSGNYKTVSVPTDIQEGKSVLDEFYKEHNTSLSKRLNKTLPF